jgi:Kef-type K+ transport system membrane component KefB
MRKYRNILFYVLVTASLLLVMYKIAHAGKLLETSKIASNDEAKSFSFSHLLSEHFSYTLSGSLPALLLQIIAIIFTARAFGFLSRKIGQPAVIGEIAAGIFLGPSVLGLIFPSWNGFLFSQNSLGNLQLFSQLGLILFMFVVGMEADLKILKSKAANAIIISHASIIVPYTLGMGLAYFLYKKYAPGNTDFLSFSLFIGIAMSITAFPVLARIIKERNMSNTRIGNLAITCAAADDITAWCILAAVISIAKASSSLIAIFTIGLACLYVVCMFTIIRPFLQKLNRKYFDKENLGVNMLALMIGVLLISAFITEMIGIHALFGAFLAGTIMPSTENFRKLLIERTEYISITLLLPLFFAFSGLRTEIGLLNTMNEWIVCGVIFIVAIAGKFGGSMLAARFVGESWNDSIIIGALINTRGLMELVVLNIGYDSGIISSEIFTMMVIMALATTCMTGPVLNLMKRNAEHRKINLSGQNS